MEACTLEVENGKNEIIEILNSRANTKGKAQRFDAMMEQAEIRKAEISQRILRLKSEEEEQQTILTKAQEAVSMRSRRPDPYMPMRSVNHLNLSVTDRIQEEAEGTEHTAGSRPDCLSQRSIQAGIPAVILQSVMTDTVTVSAG